MDNYRIHFSGDAVIDRKTGAVKTIDATVHSVYREQSPQEKLLARLGLDKPITLQPTKLSYLD
ncbi:MAG: hypothetical protein J6Y02_14730 [Pseudobutyrivibrio sp.]|nr:hypothetical protein [Pseudobutyrivibrio sp.]